MARVMFTVHHSATERQTAREQTLEVTIVPLSWAQGYADLMGYELDTVISGVYPAR
ncbi:hypothetical protein BH11PLA2_BH11PLA2_49280 [soil metagenome]